MVGLNEKKAGVLRETHVSRSLEFADRRCKMKGALRPRKAGGPLRPHPRIFPAEKRQWDPRGQLSTKLEMHHLGATQLRRQLRSSGAPHCPNSAQTRDSDSQREGGRSVQEADAGLHRHPEPAARDTPKEGSWSRGNDQIQRHRPPQPTAA